MKSPKSPITAQAASQVLSPSMKSTAILAGALFLMIAAQSSHAQTTWFWRNNESRGNNWGTTDRWWNGSSGATLTASSSLNTFLSFDGSTELTSTNNVSDAGVRGILFASGGSSRTLDGNTLRIAEGGNGKIENNSGNTQTINLTLSNNTSNGLEINPVNARLNLTNVHLGSNFVDLFGANTVEFRGQVSGSAVFTLKAASGAVTALLSASNSMTGRFDLDRGFLVLNSTNATAGTGTINIGRSSTGDSAEFQIAPSAALVNNIANGINFNSTTGAGSTRAIASLNTSGTNVVTGAVTNNVSGLVAKLYQANGGTLRFSNTISGAGGFYLENGSGGGGTVELSANNTFSGGFFIDNGTLKLTGSGASAGSGVIALGQETGGGSNAILRLSGASGGITLTNSSLAIRSGSGSRQIISENTSGINTISNSIAQSNNAIFDVATGGTLRLAGTIANSTTVTNEKSGGGALIFGAASTGGAVNQLKIGNGSVVLGVNNAGTTNTTTSTRGIDLGLNLAGSSTANNVALYASNGVTVSNSIYVAPNTSGATRTIGASDSSATVTYNNEVFLGGTANLEAGASSSVTFSGAFLTNGTTATGITKVGAGTVTLTANNNYLGATTVSNGVLNLNRTGGGSAAGSTASVTVNSGGTLLISANNQVNDSATVTLSGGTIQRGSGVTETFGNLNLTAASFIDFGTGTTNSLNFGTYTGGGFKLNVTNFLVGNILTFKTDLSGSISNTSLFGFDNGFNSAWNSGSSTFTITAIPEPSTVAAAIGLAAVFLWPARRRLVRDAKSILGLRAPMRDRLASRPDHA